MIDAVAEFFIGVLCLDFILLIWFLLQKLRIRRVLINFTLFVFAWLFARYVILVNLLSPLLASIISLEHGAFIPKCSINENISLTQELIHGVNKSIRGENVVLKINIAKAYDSIDW